MHKCVFSLLLVACAVSACAPPPEQVAEPQAPAQPLVIGTSPSSPIATLPEDPAAHDAPDVPLAAQSPLAIPARDPRIGQGPAGRVRPRALVVTELSQLEQLFSSTAKGSPQRPQIARRLADTYAELSRVADGAIRVAAHKKALTHYELITTDYPQDRISTRPSITLRSRTSSPATRPKRAAGISS
jgi:hypothetical protein